MDGVQRDYPVIERALDILRSRLAIESEPNLTRLPAIEHSPAAKDTCTQQSTKDGNENNLQQQKEDEYDIMGEQDTLKSLVLAKAATVVRRYQHSRSSIRRHSSTDMQDFLSSVLSALSKHCEHHLLATYMEKFKKSHFRKMNFLLRFREVGKLLWQPSKPLQCIPVRTRISCVARLGKIKLAELCDAFRIKRRVLSAWIQYIIS
mmetsp:Transcript_27548/g.46387  ORF Transcript_27548/g.46387 Transcript_27548/m.46387 type:complete len:205 (+) Transcript_27548:11-625(+)